MPETQVWPLGWEEPLEKGMATHSGILAWRIPWIEELQSMGLHSVRCYWETNTHTHTQGRAVSYCEWWHEIKTSQRSSKSGIISPARKDPCAAILKNSAYPPEGFAHTVLHWYPHENLLSWADRRGKGFWETGFASGMNFPLSLVNERDFYDHWYSLGSGIMPEGCLGGGRALTDLTCLSSMGKRFSLHFLRKNLIE